MLDLSRLLVSPQSRYSQLFNTQRAPGNVVWNSMASVDNVDDSFATELIDSSQKLELEGYSSSNKAFDSCQLALELPRHRRLDRLILLKAWHLIDTPTDQDLSDKMPNEVDHA
ncbi:unnamed protein product [Protopolystoma xenopodis]|uniref:Uncharacterized protein n=1 Tax=Protopolystoma xenopodis TaxID=117903 RepID=A0A3S5AEA2_9PLAT|nr:unnamed protein product [Protopolystoma xenopodis]